MGMYVALASLSEATINKLHADPPLVWLIVSPEDPEAVARARGAPKRPGLFARLFGARAEPTLPPTTGGLVLEEGEGEAGNLDKAWHGIHYLRRPRARVAGDHHLVEGQATMRARLQRAGCFPLIATLALVAACTSDNEAARAGAVAAPASVTLTATDYAFEAPDTIEAGFTTFQLVNKGKQFHMGQLMRLESGKTLGDFLVAYNEAFRTSGPRPKWATRLGGPGVAEPHGRSNATHHLEPGSYAWICLMNVPDGIPHVVKAGMAKPFVVRPRTRQTPPQRAPEARVIIQLVDYAFNISTPLTAGRHMIRVENAGAEPHEVSLLKLAPRKSMQDLEAWMQNPQGPPPATSVGGVSSLAANTEAYFEVDLTSGDYALLCFVTAPDGRPHTEHGMIQRISIG